MQFKGLTERDYQHEQLLGVITAYVKAVVRDSMWPAMCVGKLDVTRTMLTFREL